MTESLPEFAQTSIKQHELSAERINAGLIPDGMSGTIYDHQKAANAIKQEFEEREEKTEETA